MNCNGGKIHFLLYLYTDDKNAQKKRGTFKYLALTWCLA